jgi:glycerophosphoryl diester phosphodiesterase
MSEWSFSQAGRPLVVAHRGASATHPENSLAAFEAAIAAGADAVEFDVRLTTDGVPVVMHDADVSRTTDGSGLVRDLHLAEIRRLSIAGSPGAGVPTLEEVLVLCSARVGVDVEIKNVPGEPDFEGDRERAVEATLEAIAATGFSGAALVSSFNPLSLARCARLAPDLPRGLLTTPDVDAMSALTFVRSEGHGWVFPFVRAVLDAGEGFELEAAASGIRVGTWITDDPPTAVRLWRAGVEAVATNDPAAIDAARREAFG